jgi:hypothetical protein
MKRACPIAVLALATFGTEIRADELPFVGTTYATVASPTNNTYPIRASGTLTTVGDVWGGGRFIWDKDAGVIPDGLLVFKDPNNDKIFIKFGGNVSETGFLDAGFEIIGGTGKWSGHWGIGTLTGSVGINAFLSFNGYIAN